jgi:hypothetical protein
MGLKWLIFLIGAPTFDWYVVWFGEDQRANISKVDTCLEEIGLRLSILVTILHSIVNTIRRTYVSSKGITKHALVITITIACKRRPIVNVVFAGVMS